MSPAGCRGQCVDDGKTLAMLSWGGAGAGQGAGSVAHRDEVLSQLLRHGGRLLRHHRLLVHTHDQS